MEFRFELSQEGRLKMRRELGAGMSDFVCGLMSGDPTRTVDVTIINSTPGLAK